MPIVITSIAFFCAATCAALMGFAIQRGATCTVAAVDEMVMQRTARRLLSLVEAAFWVAAALLAAHALEVLPPMPAGHAPGRWTIVGAVLLGLGAFINGACVLGAVARFGSGEWAYLVTPLGFFIGCASVAPLFGVALAPALTDDAPLLQAPAAIVLPFVALALWRAGTWTSARGGTQRGWRTALATHVWSPHAATIVIALAFVVLLLLVGAWAYTDALAELARGMSASTAARLLLFVALLGGASWGGWTAGLFRSTPISAARLARCFAGGVLMGWGSQLLPGGNDGLVLVAMPLAWPYAWLAFATMCLTIAAARLLTSPRAPPAPPASRRRARGTR